MNRGTLKAANWQHAAATVQVSSFSTAVFYGNMFSSQSWRFPHCSSESSGVKTADPLVQNIVYRSTYVFHRKPHFLPSTQLRSWKLHHLQKELRTFFLTSTTDFVASFFPKWGVSENSRTKKRTLMVQEFMTIIPTTHDHIFGGKSWQIPWNQGVDPSPGTWRPTYGPWSMVMGSCLTEICTELSPEWELITFYFKRFYALWLHHQFHRLDSRWRARQLLVISAIKPCSCVFSGSHSCFFKDDLDVDRHWPLKLDLKISQSTTILSFFLHFQAGCPVSWPLWTGHTM